MLKSTLTVLALPGAASTANSTTSLSLIGFDQQTVLGSVIVSDATATTYALACSDLDNCGIPSPFTFTQGPSTVAYPYLEDDPAATETVNLGCVVTDSASGVCSVTINAVPVLSSVTTTSLTDSSDLCLQAVLTAGTAVSNTAASTTGTSATGSSKSGAASASKSSSGSASASAASASGTTASDSKNGGLPMVTQAPFLIGAMAAGKAFVAM